MTKETPLTQEQQNEFTLNRLGYYCKVKEKWTWNNSLRKNIRDGFLFDIVQYYDNKEVMVQEGVKVFPIGELEAIIQRDKVISYYLNKIKSENNLQI